MSKYVAKKITIVSITFVVIISIFSLLSFKQYILKLKIDIDTNQKSYMKRDVEEGIIEDDISEANPNYLYSEMVNDNIEKLYISDLVGQLSLTDQIAIFSITDKLQDEDKNEILELVLDGFTQDDIDRVKLLLEDVLPQKDFHSFLHIYSKYKDLLLVCSNTNN